MKKVIYLVIFASLVIFSACKKTAPTAASPTGSVSGRLHFRNLCTLAEAAPVSPAISSTAPYMILVNGSGQTVGSSSITDGYFTFSGLTVAGTYALRVSTQKPTGFYADGVTNEISVVVDGLTNVDVGDICLDNERPRIGKVVAGFPAPLTVSALPMSDLHLPLGVAPYTLDFETTDADGDILSVSIIPVGAEFDAFGAIESIFPLGDVERLGDKALWYADAATVDASALLVRVHDEHGGDEQQYFPVRFHESILAPAPFVKAYDFSDSLHVDALTKTSTGQKAYWSRSTCCLVAIQNYTLTPHTLEATDSRSYFAGMPVTVSTDVTIHNIAGDMEFGVRVTDPVGGNYIDWGIQNGQAGQWQLKHNGAVVTAGDIGELYNVGMTLKLEIDPLAGAVTGTVVAGGITYQTQMSFSELFAGDVSVLLRSESAYSGAESALYLEYSRLRIEGADPNSVRVPVRFGELDGYVYDDSQFGNTSEMYILLDSGVYFGESEVVAPLDTSLSGYLVLTATGNRLTVLSDSESRVRDWMSGDSTIMGVKPGVIVPIEGAPFFLY